MNSSEHKKKDYNYKREDLYTVIVFCKTEIWPQSMTPADQLHCLKYRNVAADKPAVLEHFKKFIRSKFRNAKYFNIYGGITGDYVRREYL
jgi:hypothetical protein